MASWAPPNNGRPSAIISKRRAFIVDVGSCPNPNLARKHSWRLEPLLRDRSLLQHSRRRTLASPTLLLCCILHDGGHGRVDAGARQWRKGKAETTEQQHAEQMGADAEQGTMCQFSPTWRLEPLHTGDFFGSLCHCSQRWGLWAQLQCLNDHVRDIGVSFLNHRNGIGPTGPKRRHTRAHCASQSHTAHAERECGCLVRQFVAHVRGIAENGTANSMANSGRTTRSEQFAHALAQRNKSAHAL